MKGKKIEKQKGSGSTPEQKKELERLRLELLKLAENHDDGAVWRAEVAFKTRDAWAVKIGDPFSGLIPSGFQHGSSNIKGSTHTLQVTVNLLASDEQILKELQKKVMGYIRIHKKIEAFDSPESVQPDKEKRVDEFIRETNESIEVYKKKGSGLTLKEIALGRCPEGELNVEYQKVWARCRDVENYIRAAAKGEFPPKVRPTTRPNKTKE